ncbi:MAG: fibronectin type III domain-containing protein [Acidobacteria bacterium]|nr:fibronectin type III domain-containing protein [Acidobacteriota bacterium]MYI40331.1 fibronectin type III domain-containing protein [Acidobacteriota bacterium]
MKSFTGKSSSGRGWALLLALLLGAGMMISACGEEETPAPTTPTPAPAPPPAPAPEPEPTGPATPENLRVTASTSTSITWSWNTVDGALGYQGQFSPDATFEATDPTFIIVAPATSHTVSNLSGNMTGHFRVRSGTGTSLTDLTYSDWSDGVMGSTAAPPPATALAAPANVETSDPEDDSIVITWDEVDDAESYEVQQSDDGGDTWGDASCGEGGDNEVDGTTCIATGLEEGTDYEFRVRGVPASDDTANALGEWGETSGTTTGLQEVTTSGGMGDLNVTWTADADSITFSWAPMAGSEYEWAPATGDIEAANPCGGTTFADLTITNAGTGAQFEVDLPAAAEGTIIGLCVRTTDKDNRATSFAWGVRAPAGATATQADGVDFRDDTNTVATALTWTDIDLVAPFAYEMRVAADSQHDMDLVLASPTAAQARAVQAACGAGALVDQGDTDVNITLDEVTVSSGLSAYTGFVLCARMANTTGATEWAVPAAKLYSHPGSPPRPTIDSARSSTTEFVWKVASRGQAQVPRENDGYAAKVIDFDVTFEDTSTPPMRVSTATPSAKDCQTATARDRGTWRANTGSAPTITTDSAGVVFKSGEIPANVGVNADTRGIDKRVYLCVRATDGTRLGPWVISGASTVRGVTQ